MSARVSADAAAAALERNGFMVFRAADPADARRIFLDELLPSIRPRVVGYGDSITLERTGILESLRGRDGVELIEGWESGTQEEAVERLRRALLADLFLAGTNAVTADGELVNVDMVGNRIAGIAFGPRRVVLTIGTNKLVENREAAFERVKTISAPANAKRHADLSLPCQAAGRCVDCRSPDRICNVWSVVERCWPRGRIAVLLIDEELGL